MLQELRRMRLSSRHHKTIHPILEPSLLCSRWVEYVTRKLYRKNHSALFIALGKPQCFTSALRWKRRYRVSSQVFADTFPFSFKGFSKFMPIQEQAGSIYPDNSAHRKSKCIRAISAVLVCIHFFPNKLPNVGLIPLRRLLVQVKYKHL